MEFLYSDEDYGYFMNQDTFEQVMLAVRDLGVDVRFLVPGNAFAVDFVEDRPVGLSMPPFMETARHRNRSSGSSAAGRRLEGRHAGKRHDHIGAAVHQDG